MATISTHNGSKLSQRHNRRDKKITDKEKHIDPNGHHESWLDIDVRKAYADIFGGAVSEYNEKQTRKDRQITDYFQQIQTDKKKHVAYEMIVGVYEEGLSEQTQKQILWDFANGWKDRNPNLKMVGCYYHADEEGQPHIHIDYIPVAECSRGMKIQNSLARALEQQGIESGTSIHETSQILWQKRENQVLQNLCEERGIEVQRGGTHRGHENTSAYKQRLLAEENAKQREQNARQKEIYEKNQRVLQNQAMAYKKQQEEMEKMAQKITHAEQKIEALKDAYVSESFGNLRQFATPEAIEEKRRELDF